jgi:nicotinamide mononucleotide transporter PnuC
MTIALVTVITLGIIFDSSVLVILDSVLGIITLFLLAKGLVFGNLTEIVTMLIYCVICYSHKYYGEIIINGAIMVPAYVINTISWLKNKSKSGDSIVVDNRVRWKEFLPLAAIFLCSGVGVYFLLRAFDTANLVVSTISVVCGFFAIYFMIRRSVVNYIFYLISNFVRIALWGYVVLQGDLSYLPTIITTIFYVGINIFGIINWLRLGKNQAVENSAQEKGE